MSFDNASTNSVPSWENVSEYIANEKEIRKADFDKKNKYVQKDKKKIKSSRKMKPQYGIEIPCFNRSSLHTIAKMGGIDLTDEIIKEVEGLSALFIVLSGAQDFATMSAGLFLYIRQKVPTSMYGAISEYVSKILNDGFLPHSGNDGMAFEPSTWIDFIKSIKENWNLCKGNRLFGQFSRIFGLLVTFGLCNLEDVTFDIKGYKLIEPDLRVVHGNAQDIISACCDTVVFWVESCYAAWKTGSLAPFLLGSTDAADLDQEYHELVRFWDLARNGNLLGFHGVTDAEFVSRLEKMATKLRKLVGTLKGLDKSVVERKFSNILSIINDHTLSKMAAGYRRAPFAIEFFGPSSQGKTFCAEQITAALFASAGIDNSRGKKFMFDSSKKHWDGARSDINHFIINDHGNVKSDFVEVSPCDAIQKICDNAPCVAPMADLARKEKTWLEPELVTVTTNVKDLDARLYSNCPYSIQRRMHVVIDVVAKPEFQKQVDGVVRGLDTNKVLEKYTIDGVYVSPPFDDVWDLSVSVPMPPPCLKASAAYKHVEWNGITLHKVSMEVVVNYCIEMFQKHRKEQFDLVSLQDARSREIILCGCDGCVQIKGYCMKHDGVCKSAYSFDPRIDLSRPNTPEHFDNDDDIRHLEELDRYAAHAHVESSRWFMNTHDAISGATKMITDKLTGDVVSTRDVVDKAVAFGMLTAARVFCARFDWLCFVPSQWLESDVMKYCLMLCDAQRLKDLYFRETIKNVLLFAICLVIVIYMGFSCFYIYVILGLNLSYVLVRQSCMTQVVRDRYVAELATRNTLDPMVQNLRDVHLEKVLKASAFIGVIYAIVKIVKQWRLLQPQGSLEPKTQEEIDTRDKEANVWSRVVARPLPISLKSSRSCTEHIKQLVSKNLVYGTVELDDKSLMVNGLFVRSNVVLVPNHYFDEKDDLRVLFRKENPDACGGKFLTRLSKESSVLIPNTDMRVCYSPNGGSFKDLKEYFPLNHFDAHNFIMLHRKKDGELIEFEGSALPGFVETITKFYGGRYGALSQNTFAGLCGAVLISRGACGAITGFHLGGHAGTTKGCYGSFTQSQIDEAISQLVSKPSVVLSGSAEKFDAQVLGVKVLSDDPLHKKNPLNFLPGDSQITYFGSCPGRTKSETRVKVTMISEIVTDLCGVPNKWGPPKMNPEWFGWQTCLSNLSLPAEPFPQKLINWAACDYAHPILELFNKKMWNDIRPLNVDENVNGIPGKKFMDAIKISTSIGFPLSGTKREYMEDLDVVDENGHYHRRLNDDIMADITRCEETYRRGERAFPIAKACKKDEVLAKAKCRIFYGNSISLTFLVRKYFLPIVRVMMMNPLVCECAVGINSHGPEWNDMIKHVRSKNSCQYLAGDYSKFDQKLPSQVLFAGLRILIDCARKCAGYDDEALRIMQAMTGDLVFSLIAFDGNLIGLTEGGHISGNPLTAVLNSMCNSINMRCCFHVVYPEEQDFRRVCALMTYGDDNVGTVDPAYEDFNIVSCSRVLAAFGQEYTMPDKESELQPYIGEDKFEFLKRKSVFHSKLGCEIGALSEDSCFKMLHCYVRDKNTPLSEVEACAMNIDTALSEWFNHGEEIYEMRRSQMQRVAKVAKLDTVCQTLNLSYENRCDIWLEKYEPHSGEEAMELDPLYHKAISEIEMKAIAVDKSILCPSIGEVDLLFHTTVLGVNHYLFVEVKGSHIRSARWKGRQQLKRVCRGLSMVNPKLSIVGVLLSPVGYEVVIIVGDFGHWENILLPFDIWSDSSDGLDESWLQD